MKKSTCCKAFLQLARIPFEKKTLTRKEFFRELEWCYNVSLFSKKECILKECYKVTPSKTRVLPCPQRNSF